MLIPGSIIRYVSTGLCIAPYPTSVPDIAYEGIGWYARSVPDIVQGQYRVSLIGNSDMSGPECTWGHEIRLEAAVAPPLLVHSETLRQYRTSHSRRVG
eukprot:2155401-Rhodomonas_salina.2